MIDLDGDCPAKSDLEPVFRLFGRAIGDASIELSFLCLKLAIRHLDSDPEYELLEERRALAFLLQALYEVTKAI
jgi:hypothetical protein